MRREPLEIVEKIFSEIKIIHCFIRILGVF